jgi:RNA polymerase sigma-70 factor (ECF subfamily)
MPEQTSHTDVECWNGIKNHDPHALGRLYDAYVDKLFVTAMRLTDDREFAKDALQEVFIEVWTYRKTLGEIRNSQAYLSKVLRNIVFKKQKAASRLTRDMAPSFIISPEQNME